MFWLIERARRRQWASSTTLGPGGGGEKKSALSGTGEESEKNVSTCCLRHARRVLTNVGPTDDVVCGIGVGQPDPKISPATTTLNKHHILYKPTKNNCGHIHNIIYTLRRHCQHAPYIHNIIYTSLTHTYIYIYKYICMCGYICIYIYNIVVCTIVVGYFTAPPPPRGDKKYTLKCTDRFLMVFLFPP